MYANLYMATLLPPLNNDPRVGVCQCPTWQRSALVAKLHTKSSMKEQVH